MTDSTAETARLMRVMEAICREAERQGLLDMLADRGFNPMQMARAALRAADGEVIPFPARRPPGSS